MKAAKEHRFQQPRVIQYVLNNSVIQRGRAKDILRRSPNALVLKFNFAGSGYNAFPKATPLIGPLLYRQTLIHRDNANPILDIENTLINNNIIELSYKGPDGWGGVRDDGNFTIQKNVTRALCDFRKILSFECRYLYVLVKGHSRGGVAASRFANLVKNLDDRKILNVELVLLDPVPGPLHSGDDVRMDTDADRSTVIYSLTADSDLKHKIGFTPQIVRNADRIILTEEGHDCGTRMRDNRNKKIKYYFAGQYHSLSELNHLPQGFYHATVENDQLNQRIMRLWLKSKEFAVAEVEKLSKIHGRGAAIKESIEAAELPIYM